MTALIVLLVIGALILLRPGALTLQGSTMIAAWYWVNFAVCAVGLAELYVYYSADGSNEPITRYLAGVTLFCPAIAVLGAKRPQHRAWQFIVLALWATLALPAAEAWALNRPFELGDARGVFPLLLVLMAVTNWLPTRFGIAALLYGVGQTLLLLPSLPWLEVESSQGLVALAMTAICAALAVVRRKANSRTAVWPDRVWIEFRDRYGVAWGLRVQQRVNEVARLQDWGYSLSWFGFLDKHGTSLGTEPIPCQTARSMERTLKTVLRRFVTAEWIDDQQGGPD